MSDIVGMILAGGQGSRLSILSKKRAKPAVPFGGIYRIIDFTLSNAMVSGIRYVGILTQYNPFSLTDHIRGGEFWGFTGRRHLARILPPFTGEEESDWYLGTADAIYQHRDFIERFDCEIVAVLSGDHIYNMDYTEMIESHIDRKADLTIAGKRFPWEETYRFGTMEIDDDDRVIGFEEKKPNAKSNIASLGIYIFNKEVLFQRLIEDSEQDTNHDFGKNIIPNMINKDKVYCYFFDDYWMDVGTVHSYWEASMEILNPGSGLDLFKWNTRTNPIGRESGDKEPAKFGANAIVKNSVITYGCKIYGEVRNCVLSPGVVIGKGAKVEDSVIMHDAFISENVYIKKSILDKNVFVGKNTVIGVGDDIENKKYPNLLNTGITLIGKGVSIPDNVTIGKNCLIFPDVKKQFFQSNDLPSGECIKI